MRTFCENTCNCTFTEGDRPCSTSLSLDDFYDSRNNCHELSSLELDLVILGAIQSLLNCSNFSVSGRSESQRKRSRITFYYHGKRICKKTFLFLHCINKNRFCFNFTQAAMFWKHNYMSIDRDNQNGSSGPTLINDTILGTINTSLPEVGTFHMY